MSAQCPHNVRTMAAQHLTKEICLTREMLCGHSADIVLTLCRHCADIYLQGYMSALYPSSVFSSGIYVSTMSALYPSWVFIYQLSKKPSTSCPHYQSCFETIRGIMNPSVEGNTYLADIRTSLINHRHEKKNVIKRLNVLYEKS